MDSFEVILTKGNGEPAFIPGKGSTQMIAFGLFIRLIITLGNLGIFNQYIEIIYNRIGMLIIGIIFYLRAIGDIKLVGLFKNTRGTKFAKNDTKYFTTLCI